MRTGTDGTQEWMHTALDSLHGYAQFLRASETGERSAVVALLLCLDMRQYRGGSVEMAP